MSDGEKAFIVYEWGPSDQPETITFSREAVLRNAVQLFARGDEAAQGDSEMERAAWRAATKRGISKLASEKEPALLDGTREATQAWLDDNAHFVQAAMQDGVQRALSDSEHALKNAVHDAVSGWFSQNSEQIKHAVRAAALQAAREANI